MYEYAKMLSSINIEESIKYFKMTIDNGSINAMNDYAIILIKGELCPVNLEESAKYFKMAADKGDISAIINYM